MTAPELVELIADALAKHAVPAWGADGKTGTCFCSEPINAERPTIHARTRALSAHQARAVLAALTEAGEVQFGVRWHVGGCSGINRCTSKRHAERQAAKLIESGHEATVVSRLTLPWTKAVE